MCNDCGIGNYPTPTGCESCPDGCDICYQLSDTINLQNFTALYINSKLEFDVSAKYFNFFVFLALDKLIFN